MSGIWQSPAGITMPAAVNKQPWILSGAGFVILPLIVFYKLSGVRFPDRSAPESFFVYPFVLIAAAVFLFFFYCGVSALLHSLSRIEITADVISVKVGRITLRELPAEQVLTVGFTEQGFGRGGSIWIPQLVLTTQNGGDVCQAGEKRIAGSRAIRQQLLERGIDPSSKKAAGYARFERYFPSLWQGRNKYILLEFSQERIPELRKYLFSAEFLL